MVMSSRRDLQGTDPESALVSASLRVFFACGLLFVLMALGAHQFRAQLQGLGEAFIVRLGLGGMALGTFLADGFHFPIPPQAYMVLAVSSNAPLVSAFGAISVGSVLGGYVAFLLGGQLTRIGWLAPRLIPLQRLAARTFFRWGARSAVLASLLPIPYSTVCYLSGLNHLPRRVFWVLALCRLPRLAVFFALIYAGWVSGTSTP